MPIEEIPDDRRILGYWMAGQRGGDDVSVCAYIDANSIDEVLEIVGQNWPCDSKNSNELRLVFVQQILDDIRPSECRFPLAEWMAKRFSSDANDKG